MRKAVGAASENLVFLSFIPRFPPLEEIVGGQQIRPFELFHNLGKLGYRTRVYMTHNSNAQVRHNGAFTVAPLPLPRQKTLRRLMFWPALFKAFFSEVRAARRSGRRLCLYLPVPWGIGMKRGRLPHVAPGVLLFPLARKLGVITWATIHDLLPDHEQYRIALAQQFGVMDTKQAQQSLRKATISAAGQRLQVRQASFVTVVSYEMQRALIQRSGVAPDKIAVFRSGINPPLLDNIPPWEPPRNRPWRIGYLGSAFDASLSLLTKAAHRLSNHRKVQLVLGGLRTDNVSLPAGVEAAFFDNVRYKDFASFAEHVDLWVIPYDEHPYLQMAWQLKVPMDIASGRPVIMTHTKEVEHSNLKPFLFLTGNTPARIAETIDYVISHPGEAKARAQAGKEFVFQEVTWEKITLKLVEQLGRQVLHER